MREKRAFVGTINFSENYGLEKRKKTSALRNSISSRCMCFCVSEKISAFMLCFVFFCVFFVCFFSC